MKSLFEVTINSFKNLIEIEGSWTSDHYLKIMEVLDYTDIDGMSDSEIKETCLMLLQDQNPQEAALALLKLRLGDKLKEGQLKNISQEMMDEKLWEEYAEPSFHEELFIIASLLYQVAPHKFPKPDAVEIDFDITAMNSKSVDELKGQVHENFVLNILADGMDKSAILHRLYDDQLASFSIEQASKILWILRATEKDETCTNFKLISSGYWMDPLMGIDRYESNTK